MVVSYVSLRSEGIRASLLRIPRGDKEGGCSTEVTSTPELNDLTDTAFTISRDDETTAGGQRLTRLVRESTEIVLGRVFPSLRVVAKRRREKAGPGRSLDRKQTGRGMMGFTSAVYILLIVITSLPVLHTVGGKARAGANIRTRGRICSHTTV